jgi:uncharacterized protein (DUF1919 family)
LGGNVFMRVIKLSKYKTLTKIVVNLVIGPFKKYNNRKRLKNKGFTIIASNCIGAKIYQELGIEYNTPFVGLFIYAPCYIKLINNLDIYLKSELSFVKNSKYSEIQDQNDHKNSYPIGILGKDIELHFVHYKTEMEAKTKWERRLRRMNMHNLFFTFTDRDCCTEQLIKEFDKIPSVHKICFSAHEYSDIKSVLFLEEYQNQKYVSDLYNEFHILKKHFDFVNWLNQGNNIFE